MRLVTIMSLSRDIGLTFQSLATLNCLGQCLLLDRPDGLFGTSKGPPSLLSKLSLRVGFKSEENERASVAIAIKHGCGQKLNVGLTRSQATLGRHSGTSRSAGHRIGREMSRVGLCGRSVG